MTSKKSNSKFIQIFSSGGGLDALDDDGNIWIYIGNEYGWKPLNMKRLTIKGSVEAQRRKYDDMMKGVKHDR